MIILKKVSVVTINIRYYRTDYRSILQEFIWQTEDYCPEIPRIHKFLNYWKNNIDAIIHEIMISTDNNKDFRNALFHKVLN